LKRTFYHSLAAVEAQRIDALWACLDGRAEGCISKSEVIDKLATTYRGIIKWQGNAHDRDSVVYQLKLMADMIPEGRALNPVRIALRKLADAIEGCAQGN
jgi:hypothetical protein